MKTINEITREFRNSIINSETYYDTKQLADIFYQFDLILTELVPTPDSKSIGTIIKTNTKNTEYSIGDIVRIREGASRWMKNNGYWLDSMGDNIDGFYGPIVDDYTNLLGNASHYSVNIGFDYNVGIHPDWLELA